MGDALDKAATNKSLSKRFAARAPSGATCCPLVKNLTLGVFFDGTANNQYRDKPKGTHTNIARLFEMYDGSDLASWTWDKHYEIGIGGRDNAKIKEAYVSKTERTIAEIKKRYALREEQMLASNEARYPGAWNYLDRKANEALIKAEIAIAREAEIVAAKIAGRVAATLAMGREIADMGLGTGGKVRLQAAYAAAAARCGEISPDNEKVIDIFGFSRGAALARTFTNLIVEALIPKHTRVRVRFLALFDTVASFRHKLVGKHIGADESQSLHVNPSSAEHIVHIIAKNDSRKFFPLSVTSGTVLECSGAHADVGGGYGPTEDGRLNHLAAVPLSWMHRRCVEAGLPLKPVNKWIHEFGLILTAEERNSLPALFKGLAVALADLEALMIRLAIPAGGDIFEEDRYMYEVMYPPVIGRMPVERPRVPHLTDEQKRFIATYIHRSHSGKIHDPSTWPTSDLRRVRERWLPRILDKPPPDFSWTRPYASVPA